MLPYLVLLRMGFTVPSAVTVDAVSSYLAVSPLPDPLAGPSAVCFLLHFPDPRGRWALPTTVPCGARTFLQMLPSSERLFLCQHCSIVSVWSVAATRFSGNNVQISNFCKLDSREQRLVRNRVVVCSANTTALVFRL